SSLRYGNRRNGSGRRRGAGAWVVAVLGDDGEARARNANIKLAVFAVEHGFVAVVADGVLVAGLGGDLAEAGFNAFPQKLRVELATGRGDIAWQGVIAHHQRDVNAVEEAQAIERGVADKSAPDGDVVALAILDDVLFLGVAAVRFAVGDDVDDAAASLARARGLAGSGKYGVVKGMELFFGLIESAIAGVAAGVAVDGVAVLVDAVGKRTAHHLDGFAPLSFGAFENDAQTWPLCPGEGGLLLDAVVIREDRDFVIRGECALQSGERIVDPCHRVVGHALVDDQRNGEREGIGREDRHVLKDVILVNPHFTGRNARNKLSFGVLNDKRDFDQIDGDWSEGKHSRARIWGWTLVFIGLLRNGRSRGGRSLRDRRGGCDGCADWRDGFEVRKCLRTRCVGDVLLLLRRSLRLRLGSHYDR